MMDIKEALRSHRENKARLAAVQAELNAIFSLAETAEESIEGMALSRGDGGPRGQEASRTEMVALKHMEEKRKVHRDMAGQALKLIKEEERLIDKTRKVEAALMALTDRERLIIEEKHVGGNSWMIVGIRYEREFQIFLAESSLREVERKAIKKMERVVG